MGTSFSVLWPLGHFPIALLSGSAPNDTSDVASKTTKAVVFTDYERSLTPDRRPGLRGRAVKSHFTLCRNNPDLLAIRVIITCNSLGRESLPDGSRSP